VFANKNDIPGELEEDLDYWNGALNAHVWNKISYHPHNGEGNAYDGQARFDASKSNNIYGASSTVQPPACTIKMLIKY
jgi:hypothetical protein